MQFDYKEVARYLSNRSAPQERRRIETRLRENQEYRRFFEDLREIWHIAETSGIDLPWSYDFVSEDWVLIQAAMRSSTSHARAPESKRDRFAANRSPRKRRSQGRPVRQFTLVVVMVSVFLGGLWLAAYTLQKNEPILADSAFQEIITQPGQRARIPLDDGTSVRLNVASTIRFPDQFGEDRREVMLEGEAFFEVTEDSARPFIVHTAGASVEVLGTAFNVRAYDDKRIVDVVVTRGKVAMKASDEQGDSLVLGMQEMGRLEDGHVERIAGRIDVQRHLAWMESHLVFEDTPFSDVGVELERWYALEVKLEESLAIEDWRLTATFTDESIDEILDVIAASLNVRYQRDRHVVTFYR